MKVLITGAAGFIGSHLSERLLRDGHDVTAIDAFINYYPRERKESNLARARQYERFHFIEDNLLTCPLDQVLDGMEMVFHLAAQAGVRASWGESFRIYTDNNVLATQILLEACLKRSIRKFVYASSSSVYGKATQFPMSEDDPLQPLSPYGVSKLSGEQLALLYHANYNLPTVALRYFTVYGPRQRPDMGFHKFLKALLLGRKLTLYGDGLQTRDFTFIDDVVEATVQAGEAPVTGQVMNIGGGHRVTLMQVFELLGKITGREVRIEREAEQKGDMRDTAADIRRAEREIGYHPRFELETGLQKEFEWLSSVIENEEIPLDAQ